MSPRPVSRAPDVLVRLDPAAGAPLHRQLYDSLREAIVAGRLQAGARVPPARVLAGDAGVSRNTVAAALAQLAAEGYVEPRARAGTFVRAVVPDAAMRALPAPERGRDDPGAGPAPPVALRARPLALARVGEPRAPGVPRAFRHGAPALDAFPWELWARLAARRLRRGSRAPFHYGDPAGYAPLREAIAAYVAGARAVRCEPAQVVVTHGAQQALDLAARLLVDAGDAVWLEDPCYRGARAAFGAAGARLVPVPVDADGLAVDEGVRLAPEARLAYVTPSHQFPTGAVMTAARRLELLRWAAGAGAWVVEDDYDSEFRYGGRPLASLQGIDDAGRVLYVGTFSKTCFPGLRLGYVVLPPSLVDAFRAARAVADRHPAGLEQAVLADFLADGHFARHVRRMRVLYGERRDALRDAVRRRLAGRLSLVPSDAGMHAVAWLPEGEDDEAAAARARAAGVETSAVSAHALGAARPGLVLGYAGYDAREIEDGAERLARALGR